MKMADPDRATEAEKRTFRSDFREQVRRMPTDRFTEKLKFDRICLFPVLLPVSKQLHGQCCRSIGQKQSSSKCVPKGKITKIAGEKQCSVRSRIRSRTSSAKRPNAAPCFRGW